MKKILIIFLLFFVCCGCSDIKYSLKFGKSIEEYMTFNDNDNHNENIGSMDAMQDMSATEYLFQSLPYNSGSNKDGLFYAGTFYEHPDEIMDSVIFRYLYDDSIIINGSKIKVDISKDNIIDNNIKLEGSEISLYIPYYVSKHNATKVSNNTYTWKVEDIDSDRVIINFDLSKPADYMKKLISYSIIIVLVIGIICVIIYSVAKHKEANKI